MGDAEKVQEEMLKKKYGGIMPKKGRPLMQSSKQCFDSADWAIQRQQQQQQQQYQQQSQGGIIPSKISESTQQSSMNSETINVEDLPVKREPTIPPPRRQSTLGDDSNLDDQ